MLHFYFIYIADSIDVSNKANWMSGRFRLVGVMLLIVHWVKELKRVFGGDMLKMMRFIFFNYIVLSFF